MAADLSLFGYLTRPTLAAFEGMFAFDTNPLYALIHEVIYARGYELGPGDMTPLTDPQSRSAPKWSADRVIKQYPEFTLHSLDDPQPVFFTGEMVSNTFV